MFTPEFRAHFPLIAKVLAWQEALYRLSERLETKRVWLDRVAKAFFRPCIWWARLVCWMFKRDYRNIFLPRRAMQHTTHVQTIVPMMMAITALGLLKRVAISVHPAHEEATPGCVHIPQALADEIKVFTSSQAVIDGVVDYIDASAASPEAFALQAATRTLAAMDARASAVHMRAMAAAMMQDVSERMEQAGHPMSPPKPSIH